jgi:hypothetical protein
MTRNLGLPERVISLPREYADSDLKKCFAACTPAERVLFATLLFTGFREEEVVYLFWTDINFSLNTIRVTSKPELRFWPKRWEEREVLVLKPMIELLRDQSASGEFQFCFPLAGRKPSV